MLIGIGCTVPEIVNLPGQSGGIDVALDYSLATACNNNNAFSPSQATPLGGVFSATPLGLNINSSTGEVTPIGSTPQAYVIAYTVGGSTSSFNLTIKPLDNATFSYSASSFPQDASNPSPVFPFGAITDGTFSGTTGLVINSTTGEIDLSASTVASHTVTYDTASSGSSVCPNTSTVNVAVTAGIPVLAQINNVYSMEFDGINDFISCGNSLTNGFSKLSISFWANFSSLPSLNMGLVSKDNTNNRSFDFRYITGSGVNLLVSTNGVNTSASSYFPIASINIGQWYHFTGVYDGSNVLLYVDGVPIGSSTALTGSLQNTTSEFFIGKRGFGTTNTIFNGLIDEMGIFNVGLTAQEVQSIYNATEIVSGVNKTADLNDLTTPPVKWYRMGD